MGQKSFLGQKSFFESKKLFRSQKKLTQSLPSPNFFKPSVPGEVRVLRAFASLFRDTLYLWIAKYDLYTLTEGLTRLLDLNNQPKTICPPKYVPIYVILLSQNFSSLTFP